MIKQISLVAVLGLVIAISPAHANDQTAYDAALAAAKQAQKRASDVGGEWRDIGKTLNKAEKLAGSGDFAAAIKLTRKAEFQSKMGYEQAISQRGVGTPAYMR